MEYFLAAMKFKYASNVPALYKQFQYKTNDILFELQKYNEKISEDYVKASQMLSNATQEDNEKLQKEASLQLEKFKK